MILVDANLLLYAEDSLSTHHERARAWWDAQLSGTEPVCLCWQTITAFIRIATNARLHERPLTRAEATGRVDSWFAQPCFRIVAETDRHREILFTLMEEADATGNLVMDAHLAALAIENGCVLCSSDRDFARFASVKWENPLL